MAMADMQRMESFLRMTAAISAAHGHFSVFSGKLDLAILQELADGAAPVKPMLDALNDSTHWLRSASESVCDLVGKFGNSQNEDPFMLVEARIDWLATACRLFGASQGRRWAIWGDIRTEAVLTRGMSCMVDNAHARIDALAGLTEVVMEKVRIWKSPACIGRIGKLIVDDDPRGGQAEILQLVGSWTDCAEYLAVARIFLAEVWREYVKFAASIEQASAEDTLTHDPAKA